MLKQLLKFSFKKLLIFKLIFLYLLSEIEKLKFKFKNLKNKSL